MPQGHLAQRMLFHRRKQCCQPDRRSAMQRRHSSAKSAVKHRIVGSSELPCPDNLSISSSTARAGPSAQPSRAASRAICAWRCGAKLLRSARNCESIRIVRSDAPSEKRFRRSDFVNVGHDHDHAIIDCRAIGIRQAAEQAGDGVEVRQTRNDRSWAGSFRYSPWVDGDATLCHAPVSKAGCGSTDNRIKRL